MVRIQFFGNHLRQLREEANLPLRKVAAALDIDPSTLSKIERGERIANEGMTQIIAQLFDQPIDELKIMLWSDRIAGELCNEENIPEILENTRKKINYLRAQSLEQGKLDFEK